MIVTGDIAQPFVGASNFLIPKALQTGVWLGNLEGSLIDTGSGKKDYKGVYNDFRAIGELQQVIPFKVFNIANNHLLDAAGLATTLENLSRIDTGAVGAGRMITEAQKAFLLTDTDGTSYRILSFGWENIQCIPATRTREGVNPYTRKNALCCVKEALKHKEPVICFMHWNYELEEYPQPYDRQFAHELIDFGVAAVIGCHAHRVQPVEFYKGKPIVYGLGNFLFCQGHYFGGKLCFPKYCEEEYAFEIARDGYKLHYFNYSQQENRLEYVKSMRIGPDAEFDGKAPFAQMNNRDYEKWFRKNRIQKKLLPVFYSKESDLNYWMKSMWIKVRGGLINLLTKMNLKSANRANR